MRTVRWMTHHMPPHRCDRCGDELDCATGPGQVNPGDLSVCLGCGAVRQFTADLGLEPVDVAELPRKARREVDKIVKAVRSVHARRPN